MVVLLNREELIAKFETGDKPTGDDFKALIDSIFDNAGAVDEPVREIACYGDSLTEGAGSSNPYVFSFPSALHSIINNNPNNNFDVANRGIGGEDTEEILIRQGAYADFIEPFDVPGDSTLVEVEKSTNAGSKGTRNGVNPVSIKGIEGYLSYDNEKFFFSRGAPGEPVNFGHYTPLIRKSAVDDKHKIQILFMGQNGGWDDDPDTLISQYNRAINYLGHNKYIIIGLTSMPKAYRQELEKKMNTAFGINYINMREYLVKYGMSDNNMTPNQEDIDAMAQGIVPFSLLTDGLHFNNEGYASIAKAVYERGKVLGFWL